MLQTLKAYDPHVPMTLDDVAARFPTLQAERPHASRSDRFAHIRTIDVLRGLETEGFAVHGVQVARAVKSDRDGWQKHVIRLRKPGMELKAYAEREVGDVHPEIILRNAHDGTSAYELFAGLFRLICKNGLTVGTQWGSVRVTHAGKAAMGKVIDATYQVVNSFDRVVSAVQTMRAITMERDEAQAFAEQAFRLRYDVDAETGEHKAPVSPGRLLEARRVFDQGRDLWTVYNRVQENLTQGGQAGRVYGADGRSRRASTRALTGIDSGLAVNRRLFDLAESWATSKAPPRVAELAGFAA